MDKSPWDTYVNCPKSVSTFCVVDYFSSGSYSGFQLHIRVILVSSGYFCEISTIMKFEKKFHSRIQLRAYSFVAINITENEKSFVRLSGVNRVFSRIPFLSRRPSLASTVYLTWD